jgi:hypothetical protein
MGGQHRAAAIEEPARYDEESRKVARLLRINHNHVACAWAARGPRSCSASTRRPIFTRWIGWFRSCRCRRDVRNTTGLSITATRTLSLFAASNTRSGEVLAQTAPRHTSATFVAFLGNIVTSQPSAREIHVIVDNFAIHRTQGRWGQLLVTHI